MIRWLLGAVLVGVLLAAGLLWWTGRQAGDATSAVGESVPATAGSPSESAVRRISPDIERLAPAPREFGAGHRIALLEYRADQVVPGGNWHADLLRVEVCAGREALRGGALPAAFSLGYRLPDGELEYRSAASAMPGIEPPLSTRLAGDDLAAGDCRNGWVSFALGEGRGVDTRRPHSLRFDNRAFGFVPPSALGELEWALDPR